jgi:hypothetical protein
MLALSRRKRRKCTAGHSNGSFSAVKCFALEVSSYLKLISEIPNLTLLWLSNLLQNWEYLV